MQANGEGQVAMPSLNDIISQGSEQQPNQVSYSYTTTVKQEGNLPPETTTNSTYKRDLTTTTSTNIKEEPNSTTKVVRKVVTSQQPTTQTTSYSQKITTIKTTTTSTRGNQVPSTTTTSQINTRYSNQPTSAGNRNQTNSYSRQTPQTTKTTTTTTTVQRGKYDQNSNPQVYRGNQRTVQPPTKIGNSQSYAGNRNQPRRPEASQSYKPKAISPEPGSIKKKTINRGEPVENVQITHIIYSSRPAEFHITENLNLDNLNSAPIQISKADRQKLQRSGKVTATCSCDDVEIAKPKKLNLKGNTIHYQHVRGIGMTNDRKENINPMFYSSEIKKLDPIYKQKEEGKIENVENFRSSGKTYNAPSSVKTTTKTSTYNKGSTYNQNQNYRGGSTTTNVRGNSAANRGSTTTSNRGGVATSTSNRGGMGNSSTSNRGGMGTSVKTTTTVYRGSNMGGDGEIIKETNTKVQMGSRSYKNQSQPTTYTTSERKVYTQKNFFNK